MGLVRKRLIDAQQWVRHCTQNTRFRLFSAFLIVMGSCLFLFRSAQGIQIEPILSRIDVINLSALMMCCLAYAASSALLARSWSLFVADQGPAIGWSQGIAVYGISAITKYLPGSALQYFSRNVVGAGVGWNKHAMVASSLTEINLHVLCSALISFLFFFISPIIYKEYIGPLGALIFISTVTFFYLIRKFKIGIYLVINNILYQFSFFIIFAGVAIICGVIFKVEQASLPAVAASFLFAWLAGFVVPIIPGGLGVREATGVALMSGIVGLEKSAAILAAMRIVTVTGDVIMFLAALICGWHSRRKQIV